MNEIRSRDRGTTRVSFKSVRVRESRARDSRSIAPKSGWKERDSIRAETRSRECERCTEIRGDLYVDRTYVIAMHAMYARTRVCPRTGGMA